MCTCIYFYSCTDADMAVTLKAETGHILDMQNGSLPVFLFFSLCGTTSRRPILQDAAQRAVGSTSDALAERRIARYTQPAFLTFSPPFSSPPIPVSDFVSCSLIFLFLLSFSAPIFSEKTTSCSYFSSVCSQTQTWRSGSGCGVNATSHTWFANKHCYTTTYPQNVNMHRHSVKV